MPTGGSSGGSTVSRSEPPKYLQPYLEEIAQESQKAYGLTSKDPYTGQLIATPNSNQTTGQNLALGVANGSAAQAGNAYRSAAGQAQSTLDSGYLRQLNDTAFNPTNVSTSGAIEAAIDPLRQELLTKTLPGVKSQAISGGAYGGPRQEFLTAQALNDFDRNAINTAANINYQDVARRDELAMGDLANRRENISKTGLVEQNLLQLAPSLTGAGVQADLLPGDIYSSVGAEQQLGAQDQLDEAYQQYQLQQMAPWQGLPEYTNIVSGSTNGGTATTTQANQGGGLLGAIQGGIGGLGLANSLSGIAGLGGLGSFLGTTGGLTGSALLGALFGGL